MAIHETDKVGDYGTARATCTATLAVEKAVAGWGNSAEGRRAKRDREKTGYDATAADAWYSFHELEGPPEFTRESIIDE